MAATATATATLRWVLQMHRDVPRAARFYAEGLDFSVNVCTLRWAELQSGPLKLALMHTNDSFDISVRNIDNNQGSQIACNLASQRSYSSMLSFTVPDINSTVTKLLSLGAELDGPIKYEIHGKVAAVRCIDGHMLGLFEPA
uniref:Lactoylglutathione lyase-like n=1 Tax=Oryza punctata TaxID=4537 RepID=A0A1V1H0Q3_ORYPU|nr:lactoylglutathione lyase-like [Oryza punctata]